MLVKVVSISTSCSQRRYRKTIEITWEQLAELRENASEPMVDASDLGLLAVDAESKGLEDIEIIIEST